MNGNNVLEAVESGGGGVESHACQLHNEILSQCLDDIGTYSCKEYGPRCYIIQKVILELTVVGLFIINRNPYCSMI